MSRIIYCSCCEMWFNSNKGWHSKRAESGLPICAVCNAPLHEMTSDEFYQHNADRLETIKTWEWPGGDHWNVIIQDFYEMDLRQEAAFPMITVYEKPTDYPEHYVARLWDGITNTPKRFLAIRSTKEDILKTIPQHMLFLGAQQNDDPKIIGTWI